jgi:hypothetical protein
VADKRVGRGKLPVPSASEIDELLQDSEEEAAVARYVMLGGIIVGPEPRELRRDRRCRTARSDGIDDLLLSD